jgi:hypothetical protein
MESTWLSLSKQGYWVFPTRNRNKFPTTLSGRKWDEFIKDKEHELLHAHLLQSDGTGAALCPQVSDRIPLLILDLDAYGFELDDVWTRMCPRESMPKGTAVVASPSGGFHIWFRLPPEVMADKLPAQADFSEGIAGEIRVSSKACRLIMLPDSVVTNKNGKAASYKIIRGELDPEKLPFPPESLMARLVARREQGHYTEGDKRPTEASHFLSILDYIGDVPEGGRNNFVAKIGQVLGRIYPNESFDPSLIPVLWEKIGPKLGADFSPKEFQIAVASGWTTGSKNAAKYQAREKHPTVTDVRAECESVFGSVPWMVEVWDSGGKLKETLVGFGGSPKRRNEASKIASLSDFRNLLPTLTRLSSAPMDTVARSPLFIQPGWAKVLDFMMHTEKGVDHLGVPAEEKFWELLDEWAKIAASDLLFIEGWTDKRPPGAVSPFIVWPLGDETAPAMVLTPILQETLLTQIGDIPKAKKLVAKYMLTKTLVGMKSGQKVWVSPISSLPPTSQDFIGAQYELFVRKKHVE